MNSPQRSKRRSESVSIKKRTRISRSTSAVRNDGRLPLLEPGSQLQEGNGSVMEYFKGNVCRLKVTNFLSHSVAEVFPRPGLNLVVGPNGSGKSALMCAMVLGLGGSPQLLDRSRDVFDFIQHGMEEASIEIDLAFGNENGTPLQIRREFSKQKHSVWRNNGRICTHESIVKTVKELGIQLDNLCHFMPQKRVSEFASMNEANMLRTTEGAIENGRLLKKHDELIELQEEIEGISSRVHSAGDRIEQLKSENEQIKQDKLRYELRRRYEQQLDVCAKKRPFLEFDAQRKKALQIKQELKRLKNDEDENNVRYEPAERAYEEAERAVKQNNIDARNMAQEVRKYHGQLNTVTAAMEDLNVKAEGAVDELHNAEAELNKKKEKLAKLIGSSEDAERRLERCESREELEAADSALNDDMRAAKTRFHDLQDKKANLREELKQMDGECREAAQYLRKLNNERLARLRQLEKQDHDAAEAYGWLEEHRNIFQEHVYGPIALELNVEHPNFASLVETVVPNWLFTAFVVTNDNDRRLLFSQFKQKFRRLPGSIVSTANVNRQAVHPCEVNSLARFGVRKWLSDVVTAPQAVMAVLFSDVGIDNVGIGDASTRMNIAQLFDAAPVHRVITEERYFTSKRSYYGRQTPNISTNPAKDPRFLGVSVSAKDRKDAESRLKVAEDGRIAKQRELTETDQEEAVIRRGIAPVKAKRDQITAKLRERGRLEKSISFFAVNIDTLEKDLSDESDRGGLQTLRARAEQKLLQIRKKGAQLSQTARDAGVNLVKSMIANDKIQMANKDLRVELNVCLVAVQALRAQNSELARRMERLKSQYQIEVAEAKRLKDFADTAQLTDELKKAFGDLPDDIGKLLDTEMSLRTKIQAIYQNDPGVLRKYEERLAEIKELERLYGKDSNVLQEHEDRLNAAKQSYLVDLEKNIETLSERFSKHLRAVGVAGSMRLGKERLFRDYRLELCCAFRDDGQIGRLSTHQLSGGERSIVTTMFLCALQGLTPTPLRMADELNQGMDMKNERAALQEIQAECEVQAGTQNFLVTPKLLPNIEFTDHTSVLFVLSGPWLVPSDEWHRSDLLGRNTLSSQTQVAY